MFHKSDDFLLCSDSTVQSWRFLPRSKSSICHDTQLRSPRLKNRTKNWFKGTLHQDSWTPWRVFCSSFCNVLQDISIGSVASAPYWWKNLEGKIWKIVKIRNFCKLALKLLSLSLRKIKKTAILTASPFSEEILIISFFIKIYLSRQLHLSFNYL